jgi:hypothetical protein
LRTCARRSSPTAERFKEHNIDIVVGKTKAGGREVEAMIDQGLRWATASFI